MRTAILTIPAQEHRVWALLGHLHALGFPVRNPEGKIEIYNGFDYRDYPTRGDAVDAMVADGHEKYEPLQNDNLRDHTDSHYYICDWGQLNIMRKIVESNEPTLVLENDAWFRHLPVTNPFDFYPFLKEKWRSLLRKVGGRNINMAMLSVDYSGRSDKTKELIEKGVDKLEKVDDFWARGARGMNQTAMIWTPLGAKYMLEEKPAHPNFESFVFRGSDKSSGNIHMPNIYSTYNPIISLHFFSNFDSPHTSTDKDRMFNHFKGTQL